MSRIGLKAIKVPSGVTITPVEGALNVKGPKGELTVKVPEVIKVNIEGDENLKVGKNKFKITYSVNF